VKARHAHLKEVIKEFVIIIKRIGNKRRRKYPFIEGPWPLTHHIK
jgi:hypothetical protein